MKIHAEKKGGYRQALLSIFLDEMMVYPLIRFIEMLVEKPFHSVLAFPPLRLLLSLLKKTRKDAPAFHSAESLVIPLPNVISSKADFEILDYVIKNSRQKDDLLHIQKLFDSGTIDSADQILLLRSLKKRMKSSFVYGDYDEIEPLLNFILNFSERDIVRFLHLLAKNHAARQLFDPESIKDRLTFIPLYIRYRALCFHLRSRHLDDRLIINFIHIYESHPQASRATLCELLMSTASSDAVFFIALERLSTLISMQQGSSRTEFIDYLLFKAREALWYILKKSIGDAKLQAAEWVFRLELQDRPKMILYMLTSKESMLALYTLQQLGREEEPFRVEVLTYLLSQKKLQLSYTDTWLALTDQIELLSLKHQKHLSSLCALIIKHSLMRNRFFSVRLIRALTVIEKFISESQKRELQILIHTLFIRVARNGGAINGVRIVSLLDLVTAENRKEILISLIKSGQPHVISLLFQKLEDLPTEDRHQIFALLIERSIALSLWDSLRNISVMEIYRALKDSAHGKPLDYFGSLHDAAIHPARDLYRYLTSSLPANFISEKNGKRLQNLFTSDGERTLFVYRFLYLQRSSLKQLESRWVRTLYRLLKYRIAKKERGTTHDLLSVLDEIVDGKLNFKKDSLLLRHYFCEAGLLNFDSEIFQTVKQLDDEARLRLINIIPNISSAIMTGYTYHQIKKMVESAGVTSSVNKELLFGLLLQLLPVDSVHLSRRAAKDIFYAARKRDQKLQKSLRHFFPDRKIAHIDSDGRSNRDKKIFDPSLVRPTTITLTLQETRNESSLLSSLLSQKMIHREEPLNRFFIRTLETIRSLPFDDILCIQTIFSAIASEYPLRVAKIKENYYHEHFRYESLVSLYEFIAESVPEIFDIWLHRAKREGWDGELLLVLSSVMSHRTLFIPPVRYIGGLKPSAIVSLIKEKYLARDKSIEDFLSENVLIMTGDFYSGEMTWDRFFALLESDRWTHTDKRLAADLRLEIERTKKGVVPPDKRGSFFRDPLSVMLHSLADTLFRPVRIEIENLLLTFTKKETRDGIPLTYCIGKNPWLSLYGGAADLCIAKDRSLFFQDRFQIITMIQEGRVVGFLLVHLVVEEGKRFLVLAGIEPDASFSAQHQPEWIYRECVEVLKHFAREGSFDAVVQIKDEHAYSNRESLKQWMMNHNLASGDDGEFKKPIYLGSFGASTYTARYYRHLT